MESPSRPRQPNVRPFSASWECYPGNLGSEADATNLALNKIDEFLRLLRRFNAFSEFDTYPATEKMGNKVL